MSALAKIIYEETGLTQSSTPDEYEAVASACRRFALCCDPRQPLTDDEIEKLFPYTHEWLYEIGLEEATKFARSIEAAHGIGGEV